MDIFIEGTQNTPRILFNEKASSWVVSGRSYNKEPLSSYQPLIAWLETLNGPGSYSFEFKLEFFDTSSFKVIVDILSYLQKKYSENLDLSIKWFYESDDEDMRDSGESLKEIIRLPVELISY